MARPRRRWIGHAQNLAGFAILTWFARYLWQHRTYFDSMLHVGALDVVLLIFLVVFNWLVTAAQSGVLYRASGIRIGFRENLLLTVGSAFGSYLPLMAGSVVRFHYMKSIHGLRYARSGSIFWLRSILVALSTAILGLASTIGLYLTGGRTSLPLFLLFLGLLFAPLGALLVPAPRSWLSKLPRARVLRDFLDGLDVVRSERRHGLWVFLFILLQQLCLVLRFAIAARATGQPVPLLVLLMLAPLANFVTFVSITPASVGLREAVMGYATYSTGMSFGSGLFVGTVDRAVLLAMVTLFGGASLIYLWHKIRRAEGASPAGLTPHLAPPVDEG